MMKIAMFTNTYLPHVGGVARAVQTLENGYRKLGHEVHVIAPEFKDAVKSPEVLRVPAIQNFNGSEFSVCLPVPNVTHEFLSEFHPDVIHSHHPFLLGDSALREARKRHIPVVFTHHTLYERYTHYVPMDSLLLKRVAIQLSTEYCNLCDRVVAPSESIERLLKARGVTTPVKTIPTGIDLGFFAAGNGERFREEVGIDLKSKVIGHVGRLAIEKNLSFLADAVAASLREFPNTIFLIVGDGDAREDMLDRLTKQQVRRQVRAVGKLTGYALADAYAAMDWFVFTSQTETQGLVIAEAMAAGKPVCALDGSGVREIVHDGENGVLLEYNASAIEFSAALGSLIRDPAMSLRFAGNARMTAMSYGNDRCVECMLEYYSEAIARTVSTAMSSDFMSWDRLISGIEIERDLFFEKVSAAAAGMIVTPATEARLD